MQAQTHLQGCGAEDPKQLYQLAKWVGRGSSFGVGIKELLGSDPEGFKTIERASKWAKAGLTQEQLRERGDVNAKWFVKDMVDVIPPGLAPSLSSPASVFFNDLQNWNQKMWAATTDGLNLVSDAIQNGRLDQRRFQETSDRLQNLSDEGPWSLSSGIDFVKKAVEKLPGVGGILKAFWGG